MSAAFEDESENDNETQTLYANKAEWADVVPVQQYEGVTPLAPIFYSREYKDATDYFRGIVKTGEKSPRVLALTEHIIQMNPAHYSAWQYRYHTLIALNSPLQDELRLMDNYAINFLKTYQVWHHRRLLLTALHSLDAAEAELRFIARALSADAKNYHTWSYRQWVLAHFNDEGRLWAGERGWVEELLEKDVRNNSAWHHRFFVVWLSGVRTGDEDCAEVLKRELAFTKEKIALAPNNPSAWNYLRGVLGRTHTPFSELSAFAGPYAAVAPPATTKSTSVLDLENPLPSEGAELPAVCALEFLADVHEQTGGEQTAKAVEIWKSLGNDYDTMRKKYWEYRIKEALQAKAS